MINRQFPRLFHRHILRHVIRHPLLALMNVLGISLGVAVFLAIQLANRSAANSFESSVDQVAGKATLEIRGSIDETLFPKIAKLPGVKAATLLVHGVVTLADQSAEHLQIYGIDPFTNQPFRTFEFADQFDFEKWLSTPAGIVLSKDFANRLELAPGDTLAVAVNGVRKEVQVLDVLTFEGPAASGNARFAVMDIGWAQELFGIQGRLHSIQLQGNPDLKMLKTILPPDLEAGPPQTRSRQVNEMLSSFRLNLTALSMVSLLVGMFLIHNTISASVVRRRLETGILRSLGLSQTATACLFLGEALLYGVAGVVLGLLGGTLLAGGMLGALGRTISALYELTSVESLTLSPLPFLAAAVAGLLSVLLSAWVPAREAARTNPVECFSPMMETTAKRSSVRSPHLFAPLLSMTAAVLSGMGALSPDRAWLGFGSAFFTLLTFALFAPAMIRLISRSVQFCPHLPVLLRMAADNLRRSLHRNATTLAAMMAAVAMMCGITIMIHSFRVAVNNWITQSITADLFVGPAANAVTGPQAFVPESVIEFFKTHPGTDLVDTYRQVTIGVQESPVTLATVDGGHRGVMRFIGRKQNTDFSDINEPGTILVTESLAYRLDVEPGETLVLPTPAGNKTFQIAGVYRDYTSDRGLILMARSNFDRFWKEPGVHSLAVYLKAGVTPHTLIESFHRMQNKEGLMTVYSNRDLRIKIFEIFDQTFSITYVLRSIAVIISVIGVFLTLAILVEERRREIALLRAVGLSPGQTRTVFLLESGLLGMGASVLGIIAGVALAAVLTSVINKAFFGWTIELEIPWTWLALVPFWIIPASVLAGLFPSWKASRTNLSEDLRAE